MSDSTQDRFSIYISPDNQRRMERAAKTLTERGVMGLYHARNGQVNRSALLSYLLRGFNEERPRTVPAVSPEHF